MLTVLDLHNIAQAYTKACERIASLIKKSSFKITWIMEEIGLGRAAFYARLNAANWEPRHLEAFSAIFAKCPNMRGAATTNSAN